MAEQTLLFHAFLIYKGIQGNNKLKIDLTTHLKEKKYLEKTIKSRLSDVLSGEVLLQIELIRPSNNFY